MSKSLRQRNDSTCRHCDDSGIVERPTTADHILTDTKPWSYCTCNAGTAAMRAAYPPRNAWEGIVRR